MYSDDPAGNKPDTTQGGQLAPDTLTQRLKTIWQKYPLVSIFVFVLFIGCSILIILTYRIFYDLTHDFSANITGDVHFKFDGRGNFGGGCNEQRTRCGYYYIALRGEHSGTVQFELPADLHAGTYELWPTFEITAHDEAGVSVIFTDESGITYSFGNEDVVSGYVTIKHLPRECYDEIRGEFEARLSRTSRFGTTHRRTVDIEIKGNFDFDPYVYYDNQALPVRCEQPFAW